MVSPKAFQMLLDNTNCISICYNGNVYTENIDNHLQVVTYIMGLHLKTELCPQSPCYFITSFIAGMEFDAVRNVILHLMVVEWNLWSFCCFQQNFFSQRNQTCLSVLKTCLSSVSSCSTVEVMCLKTISASTKCYLVSLDLSMCVSPKVMEESVVRGNVSQKVVLSICTARQSSGVHHKICSFVFFWGF